MVGDVFQERFDRVLRGIPNVHNIADDVPVDGKADIPHDKSIIILLETAGANNITFTHDKFVFKSKDLKFFCGNQTPEGYKVYPKKVKTITEIKPPQNLQHHQSYHRLVNFIDYFSPKLEKLAAP